MAEPDRPWNRLREYQPKPIPAPVAYESPAFGRSPGDMHRNPCWLTDLLCFHILPTGDAAKNEFTPDLVSNGF